MTVAAGVTVGKLLQSRPETLGLDFEILAGSGGLNRRILSPYTQKTGLALAGFHEYLREGRILVFGNSEVRYLESLNPADCADTNDERYHMRNLPLPLIRMPVAPGRNLAILVEIAARNQLLRARGHHAAKKLADTLEHQRQLARLDELDESEIDDLADPGDGQ
jgi:serine kinase of HPr protein (carbohydrate metabolism regulator)